MYRITSRSNTTHRPPIPTTLRPSSIQNIGLTDHANHQYDIHDFFDALAANNLPAVSYLKASAYQDAHPGNSNPLDEQAFVVQVINALQQSSFWKSTAVVIAYDDSDGWYDHQMGPIVNGSFSSQDDMTGPNACGTRGATPVQHGPNSGTTPVYGRCGYGMRTPLLVISSWAKANFVDHTVTDQSSVVRFIEDNWLAGARIGGGSMDALANSIDSMFNFSNSTFHRTRTCISSPRPPANRFRKHDSWRRTITRRDFLTTGAAIVECMRGIKLSPDPRVPLL